MEGSSALPVTFRPTIGGIAKQTLIYGTLIAFAPVGFLLLTGQPTLAIGLGIVNVLVVAAVFAGLARSGRQDLRLTAAGIETGGILRSLTVGWGDVGKVELRPRGQQVWILRRSDKGKEPVVIAPFVYGTSGEELYELIVRQTEARADR